MAHATSNGAVTRKTRRRADAARVARVPISTKGIDDPSEMGISGTGLPTTWMNEAILVDARLRTLRMLSGPTIHELRGAANVLALHLQLLAIEPQDDDALERRRRSLAAADDGRRRLFDIAEVFVRHAAPLDARPLAFDLGRVVDDAVALARPYAAHRRVALSTTPAAGPAPALGRRDAVTQVMLDLLLALLDRLSVGDSLDVAVETAAGHVQAVLRASAGEPPDAVLLSQVESALQWAGGTLRVDDDGVVVRLPSPPPGDSDES